jgi:hypothetical protein
MVPRASPPLAIGGQQSGFLRQAKPAQKVVRNMAKQTKVAAIEMPKGTMADTLVYRAPSDPNIRGRVAHNMCVWACLEAFGEKGNVTMGEARKRYHAWYVGRIAAGVTAPQPGGYGFDRLVGYLASERGGFKLVAVVAKAKAPKARKPKAKPASDALNVEGATPGASQVLADEA